MHVVLQGLHWKLSFLAYLVKHHLDQPQLPVSPAHQAAMATASLPGGSDTKPNVPPDVSPCSPTMAEVSNNDDWRPPSVAMTLELTPRQAPQMLQPLLPLKAPQLRRSRRFDEAAVLAAGRPVRRTRRRLNEWLAQASR